MYGAAHPAGQSLAALRRALGYFRNDPGDIIDGFHCEAVITCHHLRYAVCLLEFEIHITVDVNSPWT
jgi:hypothetical protein